MRDPSLLNTQPGGETHQNINQTTHFCVCGCISTKAGFPVSLNFSVLIS